MHTHTHTHTHLTIRLPIGGGNDYNTTVEENSEEALENHGIRYISDLKLIKAKEMSLIGNVSCYRANGIVCMWLLPTS